MKNLSNTLVEHNVESYTAEVAECILSCLNARYEYSREFQRMSITGIIEDIYDRYTLIEKSVFDLFYDNKTVEEAFTELKPIVFQYMVGSAEMA